MRSKIVDNFAFMRFVVSLLALVAPGALFAQIAHGGRPYAWGQADPLSDRERQVLRLAGEGLSAPDIGERLHLSHGTVRNYLSEAISKLGVSNRIEAYRLARDRGWL